ncbi:MAG TPA: hypothetical protein VGR89_11165 [Puia sp.]|nr:hypothetical protein [Puia sp.]
MKRIVIMMLLMTGGHSDGQEYVNPTGTYLLKGDVRNNQIIGHYGELRVRLLDSTRIAPAFYLNNGYPAYESGSFVDTLPYDDNRAVYRPGSDSSCSIVFSFAIRSAQVSQVVNNPGSGCGFRPGVIEPELLHKTSSGIPVIQDLSVHGSQ